MASKLRYSERNPLASAKNSDGYDPRVIIVSFFVAGRKVRKRQRFFPVILTIRNEPSPSWRVKLLYYVKRRYGGVGA